MPSTKNVLTRKWKKAFADNWVHDFYEAECSVSLDPKKLDTSMGETNTKAISKHMVGPYLILPTMDDDHDSSVDVLSVVGFAPEKEIDVSMGNPSCGALVFVEIPNFQGPRGALLMCSCDGEFWLTVLK